MESNMETTQSKAKTQESIVVIGAGPIGCMMAIKLSEMGFDVALFDSRQDPRITPAEGKPVNLALSTRGIKTLEAIGIKDEVLSSTVPMFGRAIHNGLNEEVYQPYGTEENHVLYSTHRDLFTHGMLNIVEKRGIKIAFGHKCIDVDFTDNTVKFLVDGEQHPVSFTRLFGTDGTHSIVRRAIESRLGNQSKTKRFPWGYRAFTLHTLPDGSSALTNRNRLHIWPGEQALVTCLPIKDGTFNGAVFFPKEEGKPGFGDIPAEQVPEYFEQHFPTLYPLVKDTLAADMQNNPVGSLFTVRTDNWHYQDKAVLLGDSASGVVPFLGLGVNTGFEGCLMLGGLIKEQLTESTEINWLNVFDSYAKRKVDTDVLAGMSENAAQLFQSGLSKEEVLKRRGIEIELQKRLPDHFMEEHAFMSFTTINYSVVRQRLDEQNDLLESLSSNNSSVADIDFDHVINQVTTTWPKIDSLN